MWLNYHHLLYFWSVARLGTIAAAAEELRLAPPTISGQLRQLEAQLGERLFVRRGRRLALTEAGRTAQRYADDIFSLGRELVQSIHAPTSSSQARPMRFTVGIADVLPASLVERCLHPALRLRPGLSLVCRGDQSVESFVAELALYRVDVVIADGPPAASVPIKTYAHFLGECGTTFFSSQPCSGPLARILSSHPVALPGPRAAVRQSLDRWLSSRGIRPNVLGEFDQCTLANEFGERTKAIFMAPSVIEAEVLRRYRVNVVGRAKDIKNSFYAISLERRVRHPAVAAICEAARTSIFADAGGRNRRRGNTR